MRKGRNVGRTGARPFFSVDGLRCHATGDLITQRTLVFENDDTRDLWPDPCTLITHLPDDCLIEVLARLPRHPRHLAKVSRTCKRLREMASADCLWRAIYIHCVGAPAATLANASLRPASWCDETWRDSVRRVFSFEVIVSSIVHHRSAAVCDDASGNRPGTIVCGYVHDHFRVMPAEYDIRQILWRVLSGRPPMRTHVWLAVRVRGCTKPAHRNMLHLELTGLLHWGAISRSLDPTTPTRATGPPIPWSWWHGAADRTAAPAATSPWTGLHQRNGYPIRRSNGLPFPLSIHFVVTTFDAVDPMPRVPRCVVDATCAPDLCSPHAKSLCWYDGPDHRRLPHAMGCQRRGPCESLPTVPNYAQPLVFSRNWTKRRPPPK